MVIQSKRVYVAGQFISAQIEIEQGKIVSINNYDFKTVDKDYGNKRIVPGFIDIHTHGAYGFDTNDANVEGLIAWMEKLPNEGVTAFLPTTVTQSETVLLAALENVAKVHAMSKSGAEILGVHFEGPYLDDTFKGAQPGQHITKPSVEQFKQYNAAANNLIKVITMACEHDENFMLTKYAVGEGVLVSQGHSGATYEQAVLAIANGANSFTHAFNGMSALHHREPNVAGALMRSSVYKEIIADMRHVHPAVVNSLFKTDSSNLILITDSLSLKGMPIGNYQLGGNDIVMDEHGTAFIKGTNTLSGSTLKVNEGLRNLVEVALVPFTEALDAATINPARALNVDDYKGKLAVNYDADVVVMNDDYSIFETYTRGIKTLKNDE